MGTTNISGIGKTFVQGQSAGVNSDIREEDEKISFLDMMNQMAAQPGDELFSQDGSESEKISQVLTRTQTTDNYDRYQYRENGVRKQDTSKISAADERVTEKLSAYEKNVKEVLKEELGVREEQIEEAMEALGLAVIDLMNPNLLAGLVAKLTGCQNVSELLCNDEFMTVMQTVNELTGNLLKELGVSLEELTQSLEESMNSIVEEAQDNPEAAVDKLPQDVVKPESNVPQEEAAQETVQRVVYEETQEQQMDVAADESEEDASVIRHQKDGAEESQITEENAKTTLVSENTALKGGQASDNGQSQDHGGQTALFGQNQTEMVHVQGTEATAEFAGQVDVSDIIKQITEFARVSVRNAATTMEMQLNPENLGKVYLEITSKAGTVSAHITAQNEIVKEALEAQLTTLKENMNQAGVKIDAVEVTVGSHEFEKNLEQNAKQDERQAEEQEASAKRTRSINLNDLDELNGIMSEEESLVAQMMAEQGNSVDFTA